MDRAPGGEYHRSTRACGQGGFRVARIGLVVVLAAASCAVLVPAAPGSNLIDRNATNVRLVVTQDGAAHLLYLARGSAQHIVAWGAENADFPNPAGRQVEFKVNYAGGWGTPYYAKDVS